MKKWLSLPKLATAPFCPSEVQGSVVIPPNLVGWKKIFIFFGPALLVSVGYMDPGNWATDIAAGSRYGYNLLFVVLLSSLAAIFLQCLSLRVGLVTQRDLAQLCRDRYSKKTAIFLWILAEIAIIATDVAEVLGCALAFKLLFGCSLTVGIAITTLDTLLILGLKGRGFRQIEAIVLGLVLTIGICYFVELYMAKPDWHLVALGLIPSPGKMVDAQAWYLAIGILGATVMPHNLYLHSSIVQTRQIAQTEESKRRALKLNTWDTVVSLSLAFFVNAAILILAAAVFYKAGHHEVAEIDDAYRLLEPIVGGSLAAILFGVALLASGQSSTFTGTIAGQIIMEGFLKFKIPCWKRRLLTRALALGPAFLGVFLLGDSSTGRLLVLSQVVLSFQLPFAIYPLIRFASSKELMGPFKIKKASQLLAWILFLMITAANLWLLWQL
jgi:manganese transport protein